MNGYDYNAFSTYYRNLICAIIVFNRQDGSIVYCNKKGLEILGETEADIYDKSIFYLISNGSLEAFMIALEKSEEFMCKLMGNSGIKHVNGKITLFPGTDEIYEFSFVGTNIVKENRQKRQSHMLGMVSGMENCGLVQYTIEKVPQIITLNKGAWYLLGFSNKEDYIKTPFTQLLSMIERSDLLRLANSFKGILKSGKPAADVFRIKKYNNTTGWMYITLQKVPHPEFASVLQITLIDVTPQKEMEEDNKLQEKTMRIAADLAKIIVWEYNPEKQSFKFDSLVAEKLGFHSFLQNGPDFFIKNNYIHEDSVNEYKLLHQKIKNGVEYADAILLTRIAGGDYTWNKISYRTLYSSDSALKKIVGFAEDISEFKKIEEDFDKQLAQLYSKENDVIISLSKINATQNLIEYFRSVNDNQIFKDAHANYDAFIKLYAVKNIRNKEEQKTIIDALQTSNLVKQNDNGITKLEYDYRRTINRQFVWVRLSVQLFKDPYGDVIAFVKEVNVNMEMQTGNHKMLINQLFIATQKMYFFVISLDYQSFSYNVLHDEKSNVEITGGIKILEKRFVHYFGDESQACAAEIFNKNYVMKNLIDAPKELRYEYLYTDEDTSFWCELKLIPINESAAKHYNYLLVAYNINSSKKREQALEEALMVANQAVSSKQEFLSNMSHEIRTPLNGIIGMLEIMKLQQENELKDYINNADLAAKHLLSLINDILDMSKIDSGALDIKIAPASYKKMLAQINAVIQMLAAEKNINYHYAIEEEDVFDGEIYTDEGRLRQILLNLLSNAVKYTPEYGAVSFITRYKKISEDTVQILAEIKDTGIGMSAEFLNRMFVPFAQENQVSTIGTGLGLAITKRLTELLGYDLKIESKTGVGTKVTLLIETRYEEQVDRSENCESTSYNYRTTRFHNLRALIVDDNSLNVDIAEFNLQYLNIETVCAVNGKEAFEIFRDSEVGYFDIIFMDIMMPVMDGFQSTAEIRSLSRPDAESIPIVAMTADAFTDDIGKSFENKMNYHLSKPFEPSDMMNIIAKEFPDAMYQIEKEQN